jgi:hypothetical protein
MSEPEKQERQMTALPDAAEFPHLAAIAAAALRAWPEHENFIHASLGSGDRGFMSRLENDHIYLWRKPPEIHSMLKNKGFTIEEFITLPPTGQTLEDALKRDFDISCVIITSKP